MTPKPRARPTPLARIACPHADLYRDLRPYSQLYRKLVRELGSRSALKALTKRILEASELFLAHADELRILALRYPPRAERDLEATPGLSYRNCEPCRIVSSSHQALLAVLPKAHEGGVRQQQASSLAATRQGSTFLVRDHIVALDQMLQQILTSHGSQTLEAGRGRRRRVVLVMPCIAPLLDSYLTEVQRNL